MNKEIIHFRDILSQCKIIAVINDGCNDYYQFNTLDHGGYNSKEQQCGLEIFNDFKYQNISNAHPPETPGVFVIKIRKPGTDEIDINDELTADFENIKWAAMRDALSPAWIKLSTCLIAQSCILVLPGRYQEPPDTCRPIPGAGVLSPDPVLSLGIAAL